MQQQTFKYEQQDPNPICRGDQYRLFNNHRIFKYLLEILIQLEKSDFPNYRIFEPGCGNGSKLRFFSENRVRPKNCYGMDLSPIAIDICKEYSPAAMNFGVGSVFDTPYEDNFFDIIICSGLFGCFNNDDDAIRASNELERILKPDGILFVHDINENFERFYGHNPAVMSKNLRGYDSQNGELENLLENDFTVVSRVSTFPMELYCRPDGSAAEVADLPHIDKAIDDGAVDCAYTLWTFFKNFDKN